MMVNDMSEECLSSTVTIADVHKQTNAHRIDNALDQVCKGELTFVATEISDGFEMDTASPELVRVCISFL